MRFLLTALLFAASAALCAAADLTVVRVWPGFRTAESFERISEYFGKEERPAEKHIFRSQPNQRTGYYFLIRLKNTGSALPGAKLEIQVIDPISTTPKTYAFASEIVHGSEVYQVGITGNDWPGKAKEEAVAWQLRVLAADGTVLAHDQSFLWSQPDKK